MLASETSILGQDFSTEPIRDGGDQAIAQVPSSRVAKNMLGDSSGFEPILGKNSPLVDDPEAFEEYLRQGHLAGIEDACEKFDFDRTNDRVRIELFDQFLG
jgi:hypothetical protein